MKNGLFYARFGAEKTTQKTTQNLRGLSEKIKEKEKRSKKEIENSKQASIEKKINNQARVRTYEISEKKCEDYNEIFDGFCVNGIYREALVNFIKHLKANKITMINSRLERLIYRLDRNYGNDDFAKAVEIDEAIASGFKRLPSEYEA